MKPQELYDREPEKVDGDFNYLFGHYYNFMPEITDFYGWVDYEKIENPRIEIKILKDFDFDGRRFWKLATVWFDGKPIMITRNAGREGDDHATRFVTDEKRYKKMVEYVKTLLPVEFTEVEDVVDANKNIKDLETFYGNTLDGFFERFRY
jgi:hypothetical protein